MLPSSFIKLSSATAPTTAFAAATMAPLATRISIGTSGSTAAVAIAATAATATAPPPPFLIVVIIRVVASSPATTAAVRTSAGTAAVTATAAATCAVLVFQVALRHFFEKTAFLVLVRIASAFLFKVAWRRAQTQERFALFDRCLLRQSTEAARLRIACFFFFLYLRCVSAIATHTLTFFPTKTAQQGRAELLDRHSLIVFHRGFVGQFLDILSERLCFVHRDRQCRRIVYVFAVRFGC